MTGGRGAVIGAALLATMPLWSLVAMVAGKPGFAAYLIISDRYYRGARFLFGSSLFSRAEFGTIPRGGFAMLVAALLYAVVGAMIGFAIGTALGTWSGRSSSISGVMP